MESRRARMSLRSSLCRRRVGSSLIVLLRQDYAGRALFLPSKLRYDRSWLSERARRGAEHLSPKRIAAEESFPQVNNRVVQCFSRIARLEAELAGSFITIEIPEILGL